MDHFPVLFIITVNFRVLLETFSNGKDNQVEHIQDLRLCCLNVSTLELLMAIIFNMTDIIGLGGLSLQ